MMTVVRPEIQQAVDRLAASYLSGLLLLSEVSTCEEPVTVAATIGTQAFLNVCASNLHAGVIPAALATTVATLVLEQNDPGGAHIEFNEMVDADLRSLRSKKESADG